VAGARERKQHEGQGWAHLSEAQASIGRGDPDLCEASLSLARKAFEAGGGLAREYQEQMRVVESRLAEYLRDEGLRRECRERIETAEGAYERGDTDEARAEAAGAKKAAAGCGDAKLESAADELLRKIGEAEGAADALEIGLEAYERAHEALVREAFAEAVSLVQESRRLLIQVQLNPRPPFSPPLFPCPSVRHYPSFISPFPLLAIIAISSVSRFTCGPPINVSPLRNEAMQNPKKESCIP
jgi:hypothetical protein